MNHFINVKYGKDILVVEGNVLVSSRMMIICANKWIQKAIYEFLKTICY